MGRKGSLIFAFCSPLEILLPRERIVKRGGKRSKYAGFGWQNPPRECNCNHNLAYPPSRLFPERGQDARTTADGTLRQAQGGLLARLIHCALPASSRIESNSFLRIESKLLDGTINGVVVCRVRILDGARRGIPSPNLDRSFGDGEPRQSQPAVSYTHLTLPTKRIV